MYYFCTIDDPSIAARYVTYQPPNIELKSKSVTIESRQSASHEISSFTLFLLISTVQLRYFYDGKNNKRLTIHDFDTQRTKFELGFFLLNAFSTFYIANSILTYPIYRSNSYISFILELTLH